MLDLGDPCIQAALGTSDAELTGPWLRAQARRKAGNGPLPATQALGQAALATGAVLAMRYPSAKHPRECNVVVFTDRLAALNGRITLVDESGTLAQSLP